MIQAWRIETRLRTKLLFKLQRLLRNARSASSVLPLPLMKQESRSSIYNLCGNHPMELSEIFLMEQSLENLLLLKIFQDLFLVGPNQLSLEDTLSVINIEPQIFLSKNQESQRWSSLPKMEQRQELKFMISQHLGLQWECTTPMNQLKHSLTLAFNSLYNGDTHCIYQPKIQS